MSVKFINFASCKCAGVCLGQYGCKDNHIVIPFARNGAPAALPYGEEGYSPLRIKLVILQIT